MAEAPPAALLYVFVKFILSLLTYAAAPDPFASPLGPTLNRLG